MVKFTEDTALQAVRRLRMTAPRHSRPSPRKRLRKIASSLATLSLVGAGITVAATSAAAAEIPEDFQTCSLLGTDTPLQELAQLSELNTTDSLLTQAEIYTLAQESANSRVLR